MSENQMTKEAASRIQSDADRNGHNQDFARRAQSAADRHAASNDGGSQSSRGCSDTSSNNGSD